MYESKTQKSTRSRIAHLLHNVNGNCKFRLQGLKASNSRTLFYFVNLQVYKIVDYIRSLHGLIGMHS